MKQILWHLVALNLLLNVTAQAKSEYIFTSIDPPRSIITSAEGINDTGQIVGLYYDYTDHGFLLSGGSYTTLDVPGSSHTYARGINNTGKIVGTYWVHGVRQHGYLLSEGSYTTLDVPGPVDTHATGINDVGHVVGFYLDIGNPYHSRGFLLNSDNGTYTTFNVPGFSTYAYGINDAGQIVGGYQQGNNFHGFLLSKDAYTTLDVPGSTFTEATGINDVGQITGSYFDGIAGHGFLLDNGSYTRLDVPGSTFTEATGINDVGQIVGFYFAGGIYHGFLATPIPEPYSFLLLGVGIFSLIVCRGAGLKRDGSTAKLPRDREPGQGPKKQPRPAGLRQLQPGRRHLNCGRRWGRHLEHG